MHNPPPHVVPIEPAQVYPLRLMVLRPGGTLSDCIWFGDNNPDTLHLGALNVSGEVMGIASFYINACPEVHAAIPIQLRGMATHPQVRGAGFGKAIVRYAIAHYAAQGADLMWCNARQVAVSFYSDLGFRITGEPFEIGKIGIHRRMYVPLRA